ncbi:MAG: TonB-dependent receptor [Dysgonamonadaceae bacterium]|jgi:TonB-linked SusC/RagA family outer membrane protein|nr:TonB-dependent receptor [Dysgonamonadaceae bacterium]
MKHITFSDLKSIWFLLLFLFLSVPIGLFAQTIAVQGIVKDVTGEGLIGVSVVEKGRSTNGISTDLNGNYTLNVANNAILVFSYIGYTTQSIEVKGRTIVNIVLEEDTKALEEVVVVGYGTMRKSDLTGSVTQVRASDIAATSVSNPIEALQGRAAGVMVMTANSPGSTPAIRIRGSGSIDASNEPLYVVDGFPLIDGDLNIINPNDIASIEILKDASSTAIYGSRGANGVIMITTKSGNKGRNDLNFSAYYGVQTPDRKVDLVQGQTFIDFLNEGYLYKTGKPVYGTTIPTPNYNVNWQDEVISDNAAIQDYSLSFSGGQDKTNYVLSADIFSQDGIMLASGFDRYSLRANLSHEFRKWLTVGTHLQAAYSIRDRSENPTGNIFRWGWPTFPVKNPDNSWYYAKDDPAISGYLENRWNPVADASEIVDSSTRDRLMGDVFAEFSFLDHFKFKTNFGYDVSNVKGYTYNSSKSAGNFDIGKGSGGNSHNKRTTMITENILTYSNIWNKHRFSATGVYSFQDYYFESLSISGSGFSNDVTGAYNMALADPASIKFSTNKYSSRLVSFTGRVTYSYADKYLLTATGRNDGSSRFGANTKWGFFPSFGLGWRIDQESFMEESRNTLSNAKLRMSYGLTGNQDIGNYNSLSRLNLSNMIYDDKPLEGYAETIGNQNLKWEKTKQFDIGLDIGLWNRVDITLDYYHRITTDLLYNVPIPSTSGYNRMLSNIGEVKNQGIEFSVGVNVLDGPLKWDIGGNISKNKNEVVKLYGDVQSVRIGASSNGMAKYLRVGDPVSGLWGRESAGIIRTEEQLAAYRKIVSTANLGEEMYVDRNGDNLIDEDDYICIGSTVPEFYYGFSTNLSYKNISLDVYGQGAYNFTSDAAIDNSQFGGKAIGFASSTDNYMLYGENQILANVYIPSVYAYERMWSERNPNGTFPRAGAKGVYFSDRTHGHWRYFIVKNIVLGYDFRNTLKAANWMKTCKVYFNIQNPFSFANHRGYNPENGDVTYPWIRSYTLGLSVNF